MKRSAIFILSIFGVISFSAFSQDYERIDATILLYPTRFDSPESLSNFISRDFKTDEEKVRAMYSWIIQNISYDPNEYKQFDYTFKNYRERNQKEEETRKNLIKRTLQKGIAVCEGYAMLFEKLCELQGIRNYLVRGDTKTNFNDIGRTFAKNHMWNVVYIEGMPYLFDLTWGAGKYNGKFIKEPTYFYYKTPPQLFFRSHYPDMYEDAFIEKRISREEFSNRPLLIDNQLTLEDIETPKVGILETSNYFDAIVFTLNSTSASEIYYSYGDEKLKVVNLQYNEGSLHFEVPLQMGADQLLIYFDDQPALGYRIR